VNKGGWRKLIGYVVPSVSPLRVHRVCTLLVTSPSVRFRYVLNATFAFRKYSSLSYAYYTNRTVGFWQLRSSWTSRLGLTTCVHEALEISKLISCSFKFSHLQLIPRNSTSTCCSATRPPARPAFASSGLLQVLVHQRLEALD
jgi:hypothetical protein